MHDHFWTPCHEFASGNCKATYHYREWTTRPVLLKTVPLEEQVMRQVMRKRHKALKNRLSSLVNLQTDLEEHLCDTRVNVKHAIAAREQYDRVLAMQTRTKPKRQRIELNISK